MGALSRAPRVSAVLLLIALVGVLVDARVAYAVGGQLEAEPAPMTFSPSFGGHVGLVAAMDAAGETKLAWTANTGEGHSIQTAVIAPGGIEAGPVATVDGGRHPSSAPALALAPAGRTTIAWFQERHTEQTWSEELLALQVRDQLPDGRWEAIRTIWRPAVRSTYRGSDLTVANDDAGDEAVAWLTRRENRSTTGWTVMVASRAGGGAFTRPAVLATDSSQMPPALAVNPEGEVTLLWCGPEKQQQLLTATWRAGASPPTSPTVLDAIDGAGPPTLHEGVGDLGIKAGGSGSELATWRKGPLGSNRLEAVALRAAWRNPGAAFLPTQTVTSPGVEAREPAVALNSGGRALIAWSEIASDGSGPVLNYATAPVNGSFTTESPIVASRGEHSELQDAWLPDGSALLSWRGGGGLLAEHWTPGGRLAAPSLVVRLGEESALMVAGGAGAPVIAWIGHSPLDFADEGVRYVVADGLVGDEHAPTVPVLGLTGSRDPVRQRGVAVDIQCSEGCVVTARAHAFALRTENSEEPAGAAYRDIGAFLTTHRILPADKAELFRIQSTRKLLRAYCRSVRSDDSDAIEVRVAVRGLISNVTNNFVLGENPSGYSCSH